MRRGTHNISLYQGDYFEQTFQLVEEHPHATPVQTVVDITEWTGSAEIRLREGGQLMATFTVEIADGPNGIVRVILPPEESAKVARDGVWDLQMDPPDGKRFTWLRGKVRVTPEVTV